MWIVFRYVKTEFQNLDKYVYDIVDDADILAFQDYLGEGKKATFNQDVYFLQEFFESKSGVRFYVRKYEPFTTLQTDKSPQAVQLVPDTPPALKSPVWVLLNPCNVSR